MSKLYGGDIKMPNKKARPKVRGKKNVYDEWEHGDRDRDEVEAGMKRRERRWKEIELEQKQAQKLEKKAIKNVEKMERGTKGRPPTPLEEAWLRCDYLLSNLMEPKAYIFMEQARLKEPKLYKYLYKMFMSQNMMHYAQYYVDYFARGGKPYRVITHGDIIKAYRKYKGIKSSIKIKHKGEKEKEL